MLLLEPYAHVTTGDSDTETGGSGSHVAEDFRGLTKRGTRSHPPQQKPWLGFRRMTCRPWVAHKVAWEVGQSYWHRATYLLVPDSSMVGAWLWPQFLANIWKQELEEILQEYWVLAKEMEEKSAKERHGRKVTDIFTWLQCYGTYL